MKKKTIIIVGIIVILIMGMGVSFAYWMMSVNQKDKNRITSECFKLTMKGTEGISLEKAYPITNEEGESLEPYTFTIENICETTAAYQVNLEQMETEKDISGKYIKVELDNKEPKNYDKYDETEITLKENGKEARKLTTGILRPSEKVSYSIRLWMDEKTPAISEVMNASFKSKVTVIASYLKKEEVPPEVALNLINCGTSITANVETTGNKITSYEYTINDENPLTTNESSHTFNGLENKEYHIKVKVTDEYQNVTEQESSITIENEMINILNKEIPVVSCGDGLYKVEHDGVSGTIKDDGFNQTEYRFAGLNPDNYISFNEEEWRIIGLVNVLIPQVDGSEKVEQRVKIIRNENIGNYAWDAKFLNDWTNSTLMEMLNGIYYNSSSGECYMGNNNENAAISTCNFSSNGIKNSSKNLIEENMIWNIGVAEDNPNTLSFYQNERGVITENSNPYEWKKESETFQSIGLMYSSDIGYSVGGNERDNCLSIEYFHDKIGNTQFTPCLKNSWLRNNNINVEWLLTPYQTKSAIYKISWTLHYRNTNVACEVRPALYLKSNVTIHDGNGKKDSSYTIS